MITANDRIVVDHKFLTRFFEKVHISSEHIFNGTPCWMWTAALSADGYGLIKFRWKSCYAHRISFGIFDHEIDFDRTTDHLCRTRACVNPVHLEDVTREENLFRGILAAPKTHCKRGHALTTFNVFNRSDGRRDCRLCDSIRRGVTRKSSAKTVLAA